MHAPNRITHHGNRHPRSLDGQLDYTPPHRPAVHSDRIYLSEYTAEELIAFGIILIVILLDWIDGMMRSSLGRWLASLADGLCRREEHYIRLPDSVSGPDSGQARTAGRLGRNPIHLSGSVLCLCR